MKIIWFLLAYIKKKSYLCSRNNKDNNSLKPKSRKGIKIMTTFNINDKINVVLFGDIYDATVTNNNLHNGDYLEVLIGRSHEVIGTADIVGPCSAKVKFEKDGKMKTIECCSPAQAWEYVEKVVTPNGWKLKSVTKGFEY